MTGITIDDGIPFEPNKKGRPFDERLIDIDERAARAVIDGRFVNSREAAKAFVEEYAQRAAIDDWDVRNSKIADLARRIERKRISLVST